MEKICGIYKITNKINNKCYIGQSKDIIKRWKTEYKWHKLNNHLQSAFNKYGLENFDFEIIEECEPSLLNKREKFWINIYNSFDRNFGYNKTLGGAGTPGRTFVMTEETKNKMRLSASKNLYNSEHKKKVICIETGIIYDCINKCARQLNIDKCCISRVCNGKNKKAGGYTFKFIENKG